MNSINVGSLWDIPSEFTGKVIYTSAKYKPHAGILYTVKGFASREGGLPSDLFGSYKEFCVGGVTTGKFYTL